MPITERERRKFFQKTWVIAICALVCCALWGSAFPCIKIGYRLFEIEDAGAGTYILFAGIRFVIAGMIAFAIGSIVTKKVLLPTHFGAKKIVRLSLVQTVGQYTAFYIGLAFCSGVRASIINGTNVFFAILIAALIAHMEKLTRAKIRGTILGFAGLVVVCISGGGSGSEFNGFGEIMIIVSSIFYAISSVMIKKYSQKHNALMLSSWQFFIGGWIMVFIGLLAGGNLTTVTTSGLLLLLYLGALSAIAYSLWGVLLKYNPVSSVTIYGFMIQIFGVLFSAIFLQEAASISWYYLLALVLVCAGIIVVNRSQKKQSESTENC